MKAAGKNLIHFSFQFNSFILIEKYGAYMFGYTEVIKQV